MSLKTWFGLGIISALVAAVTKSSTPGDIIVPGQENKIFDEKPMPDDEPSTSNGTKIVDVKCNNCGAEMKLNSERNIISCPYCGSKKLMMESDAVAIAKDRHKTYSDVERNRQNVYSKIEIEREKTKQQRIQNEKQSDTLRIVAFIIIWSLIALIVFRGINSETPDHSNEIKIPTSAKNYKGENVDMTIRSLETLGFTNIESKPLYDLTTGWVSKENTIDTIYINGDSAFTSDTWFPCDAEVLIYYHAFKIKE